MPVMGIVQSESCSLVCEPGVVRWVGGSRVFTERFASANVRVAAESAGAGNVEAVGESPDAPAAFGRTGVPAIAPWSSDSVYMGEVE